MRPTGTRDHITVRSTGGLDPFLLVLRSAANPRAAEIRRAGIEKHRERHVHDVVPGTRGTDRAAVRILLSA